MAQQDRRRVKAAGVPTSAGDVGGANGSGSAMERVFGAGYHASPRRGLEPAFVLFESAVMDALRSRASDRGLDYDALIRMIVRDHVDEY